jgi:hypothetical protein
MLEHKTDWDVVTDPNEMTGAEGAETPYSVVDSMGEMPCTTRGEKNLIINPTGNCARRKDPDFNIIGRSV